MGKKAQVMSGKNLSALMKLVSKPKIGESCQTKSRLFGPKKALPFPKVATSITFVITHLGFCQYKKGDEKKRRRKEKGRRFSAKGSCPMHQTR